MTGLLLSFAIVNFWRSCRRSLFRVSHKSHKLMSVCWTYLFMSTRQMAETQTDSWITNFNFRWPRESSAAQSCWYTWPNDPNVWDNRGCCWWVSSEPLFIRKCYKQWVKCGCTLLHCHSIYSYRSSTIYQLIPFWGISNKPVKIHQLSKWFITSIICSFSVVNNTRQRRNAEVN